MLREDAERLAAGFFCAALTTYGSITGKEYSSDARFSLETLRYNLPANNGRTSGGGSSGVTALNNDVIDSSVIHNARV